MLKALGSILSAPNKQTKMPRPHVTSLQESAISHCYGLNCVHTPPLHFMVEVLTLSTFFGNRVSTAVIKSRDLRMNPNPIGLVSLQKGESWIQTHTYIKKGDVKRQEKEGHLQAYKEGSWNQPAHTFILDF